MYTYPDKNDYLTYMLIQSVSQDDYWEQSERGILKTALEAVDRRGKPRMLDLGCGMGRLLPVFAPHAESIFALEPDPSRYAGAVETAKTLQTLPVEVVNGDSSFLRPDQEFDVVLSSHVLQHISNETADRMIADIAAHTAPGGCILVTTTHTHEPEDILSLEYFEGMERVSKRVDEAEFAESFSREGVLPVRMFAEDSVPKLFAKHGFDYVAAKRYYHYYTPGREQSAEMDEVYNAEGNGAEARDILFVFERSADRCEDAKRFDACLSYQYSFSLSGFPVKEKDAAKLARAERLIKAAYPLTIADDDPEAEHDPVLQEIKTSQNFLHGDDMPFDCKRFLIRGLDLHFTRGNVVESGVIFTVIPEFNAATLMFCFHVEGASTDQMVFYRQSMGGDAPFRAANGEEKPIKGWFETIAAALGGHEDMDATYFLEVKALHPYDDLETLIEKESRRLYGVLTGDEGWEYVPEEMAKTRLQNGWGSRNFVRFVVFGNNGMLINLNKATNGNSYVMHQKRFGRAIYGGVNPYFLLDSKIPGVNHGILFSQETVFVIKTVCNRILARQDRHTRAGADRIGKEIQRTKSFRSELITVLNRVENLGITEIGELEQLLLRSYKISPMIDSIKYLLELLESQLDLLYQQSTNSLINLLTITGLVLSVLEVLASMGLL